MDSKYRVIRMFGWIEGFEKKIKIFVKVKLLNRIKWLKMLHL